MFDKIIWKCNVKKELKKQNYQQNQKDQQKHVIYEKHPNNLTLQK